MCSLTEDAVILMIVELLKKVGDQWEEEVRSKCRTPTLCRSRGPFSLLLVGAPPVLPSHLSPSLLLRAQSCPPLGPAPMQCWAAGSFSSRLVA
jgi:hypothetical protein